MSTHSNLWKVNLISSRQASAPTAEAPGKEIVADLCKVIERQSQELATLRAPATYAQCNAVRPASAPMRHGEVEKGAISARPERNEIEKASVVASEPAVDGPPEARDYATGLEVPPSPSHPSLSAEFAVIRWLP